MLAARPPVGWLASFDNDARCCSSYRRHWEIAPRSAGRRDRRLEDHVGHPPSRACPATGTGLLLSGPPLSLSLILQRSNKHVTLAAGSGGNDDGRNAKAR